MSSTTSVVIAALAASVLSPWPAYGEVPTKEDFATCNKKAAEEAAADTASASPRTDGAPRAGQLPSDARQAPSSGRPNTLSSDKDPQIEGLAADRANDRSYVAAYRSCMRQRGF